MARKITIMAVIAGIVLGVAATEGFNVYRQSHDSRIFQERVHCKALADAYVKANSTDVQENPDAMSGVSVTLDKVDYSPARNSCVAELETSFVAPRVAIVHQSVQDLLSGETLFSVKCAKDCVEEFQKMRFVDPAFDYVMNNASEPLELEKAYAQMESEIQSKSAPKIDPATGERTPGNKDKWDQYAVPTGRPPLDPRTGEPVSKPPPKSAPPSGR